MRGRHRRKNRKQGRIVLTLGLAVMIALGVQSCRQGGFWGGDGTGRGEGSSSSFAVESSKGEESSLLSESSQASSSAESSNENEKAILESQLIPVPDASSSDWNLILVNRFHQLTDDLDFEPYYTNSGKILDSRIAEQYENMMADGEAQGLQFVLVSSYRTLAQQQANYDSVYNSYLNQGYPHEEAIQKTEEYIALPDASEHSTGLAVDITEPGLYSQKESGLVEAFEETPEGKWLHQHATEYGFILRYPRGKEEITYIEYESWHFRYVGLENAKYMKEHDLTLEEYTEILQHNEEIHRQLEEWSE